MASSFVRSTLPASDSPVLPRGLIFLSSLWLVGSWLVAIGVRPPVQPSSASYTPGVRLLLDCMLVGVCVAWPLLRLSQPRCAWSARRALLDVIVIAALLQLVVWPMRLVTPWSVQRTLLIDVVLLGWAALAGAVVAIASTGGPGVRTLGMIACLALPALGPAAALVAGLLGAPGERVTALALLSPFASMRALSGAGPAGFTWSELAMACMGLAAAVPAWIAVAAVHAIRPQRRDDPLAWRLAGERERTTP